MLYLQEMKSKIEIYMYSCTWSRTLKNKFTILTWMSLKCIIATCN